MVGDIGVGKTSLIKRYVHNIFSMHYKATIGVDFALKVINWDAQTVVRLQLWCASAARPPPARPAHTLPDSPHVHCPPSLSAECADRVDLTWRAGTLRARSGSAT